MSAMYVFNLPAYGSPFLTKVVQAKDIKKDILKTIQDGVGGRAEGVNVKARKLIIHPMFCKENEKWKIVNELMWNQYSKVWVNENGACECLPNMAVIIGNHEYRESGCPHLWGDVIVCVSQKVYEKICNKPLEYWKEEEDDEEEDDEEEDDEEEED